MRSSTKKKAKYYVFPAVIQASSSLSLSRSLSRLSLSLSLLQKKNDKGLKEYFLLGRFL